MPRPLSSILETGQNLGLLPSDSVRKVCSTLPNERRAGRRGSGTAKINDPKWKRAFRQRPLNALIAERASGSALD